LSGSPRIAAVHVGQCTNQTGFLARHLRAGSCLKARTKPRRLTPHQHSASEITRALVSQQKRKLIEQVFGWMKTVGGLRKLRHRGGELVDWIVTFTAAAYNLIRLRTLLARAT
jgi:hypothetical protein